MSALKPLRHSHTLVLAFAALALTTTLRAAQSAALADFDNTTPDSFTFKDEKGSVFNVSPAYSDAEKGKHLGLRYRIEEGGWSGWGMLLKNYNASPYRYLVLDLRGEKGGESFEIGLRDSVGKEKKYLITRFADPTPEWQEVFLPLSDFSELNLASLENLTLGFNDQSPEGLVRIDNVRFITDREAKSATGDAGPVTNKALVDGFERTNPFDVYRVFQGDESSLALTSSRLVYEGDYAMEMEYKFSTSRPWGSWVSAVRDLREPLDWTGAQEIKIWVKGDGSDSSFRFRVIEPEGETWEYVDEKMLASTRWTLLTMPIQRFSLVEPTKTDGDFDLISIGSYQLDVLSPTSQQTSGAKTTSGRIYVDQLYVAGERLRAIQSAPPATVPQLRIAMPSAGNVDFTLNAITEYFFTPEQKSRVNHLAKLITTGKVGNYSARVEFGTVSQEFGESASYVGSSVTATDNRFPAAEIPSLQVMVNNVSPFLSNVTLGNIWVDYSPYTFSPVFGYKGASAEGDYDRLNYHAFAIKHVLNSFTTGTRWRAIWPHWKLTAYGVYWEQNARLSDPSELTGSSLERANSSVLQLERVAQDLVYNFEAENKLFHDRLTLRGVYGRNEYHQSATMDISDRRNPIFGVPLETSLNPQGDMWRGRVQTDSMFVRGLATSYEYRDVDTAYKPRYRQNPAAFDDDESDQWGHNFRLSQYHRGWIFSNEYDTLRRHSSREFYRHRYNWGVGYYGYHGIDVAFNQEYRRKTYTFTSDRSAFTANANEKIIASEVYVRTQISPRLAYWIKPRQERIWHPLTNRNFVNDVLHMKLEFYVTTNAKFFAESRIDRRGDGSEPLGEPYDDNFTRVSFEVTF